MERPTTRQRIWSPIFFLSVFVFFGGITAAMIRDSVHHLSVDRVFLWPKFLPLVVLGSVFMAMMAIKCIAMLFRRYDSERPDAYYAPFFRYENILGVFCIVFGLIAPFIFQPIVDFVVVPIIGYEYCAELTERGPTFGFPTYAYVPDPALCVSPDSAID